MAVTTKQLEDEQKPESKEKKSSFRERALAYMAEGPHLSPEVAEELRRTIREAKEENFVQDIPA